MKRYKLIKDLPTFNAGDEFYVNDCGDLILDVPHNEDPQSEWGVTAYCQSALQDFPNILNDWFEEIKEEPKTVYDLKNGEICYLIDEGRICDVAWLPYYEPERDSGDICLTKEGSEKELAWRKARQILKQDAKGFKPDWTKAHEDRYNVVFSLCIGDRDKNNLGCLQVVNCVYQVNREFYFATQADAEESMRKHSQEWKIYLGVEE